MLLQVCNHSSTTSVANEVAQVCNFRNKCVCWVYLSGNYVNYASEKLIYVAIMCLPRIYADLKLDASDIYTLQAVTNSEHVQYMHFLIDFVSIYSTKFLTYKAEFKYYKIRC